MPCKCKLAHQHDPPGTAEACMHASFVLRLLSLQHQVKSMPLTVGETPICLSAQRGKGCTIQDVQAVTQDNFCPGSNQAASSSGSSSDQAGSSPDRETMADDDYGEYNGLDGYADDDGDDDVSNDDYYCNNDSQSDDNDDNDHTNNDDNAEHNDDENDENEHTNNDNNAEGGDDDDDENDLTNNDDNAEGDDDDDDHHSDDVTTGQEASDSSPVVCSRLQDFHSLVDHAQFEWQKEQIEGHIRSNSLVFITFIFLQVTGRVVLAQSCSHAPGFNYFQQGI